MSTDTATLLGEHATSFTHFGYGDDPRAYCFGCREDIGPSDGEGNAAAHRAHLAAVIDAHTAQVVREAAEKAVAEVEQRYQVTGVYEVGYEHGRLAGVKQARADKEADHAE